MIRAGRLLAVGLALLGGLAPACNRVPAAGAPAEAGAALLEVRDPRGQPSFRLARAGGEGFSYHDAAGGAGQVQLLPGARWRTEVPGRGALEAWRLEGGAVELRGQEGPRLRLTREGGALRLADGAAIPVARLRRDGAEVLAHDPGGRVVARVTAGGGRRVVADREGRTLAYVLGEISLEKAALAVLPGLSAPDRVLLLLALPD